MKKILIIFFCLVSIGVSAQRIGAGLAYGSEIKAAGIAANGEFFLSDKMAVSPGVIIYFKDAIEINGNINFLLGGNDAVLPYAIGGLNLISANGSTELGLNAGVGANFDIGAKTKPFAEVKYVLGDADQLVLVGGVKIPFKIN